MFLIPCSFSCAYSSSSQSAGQLYDTTSDAALASENSCNKVINLDYKLKPMVHVHAQISKQWSKKIMLNGNQFDALKFLF